MIKISIVMPVYNGVAYIGNAIQSILNQTFPDFELIIIDDGSTDRTISEINRYKDRRIVLLKNNHDFIQALNTGLQAAKGKYIARMDADDMMHPQRLEIQWRTMEQHPDVAVCGTSMKTFGQSNQNIGLGDGYVDSRSLLSGNIVAHPTTLLRKDFLEKNSIRYERYEHAEDYKLWCEIAKCGGRFFILPQMLLFYRMSPGQVSQKYGDKQQESVVKIRHEFLDYLIETAGEKRIELQRLRREMKNCYEKGIVSEKTFFELFQRILLKA